MVDGQAGKGSRYRKVDQMKYRHNWLRIFGVPCPNCKGNGMVAGGQCDDFCPICNGVGYMEKKK